MGLLFTLRDFINVGVLGTLFGFNRGKSYSL